MSDDLRERRRACRAPRREFLALPATAVTALTGCVSYLSSESETNPNDQNQGDESEEKEGENIADYGAAPNPDDPDFATARRNIEAIWEAAGAAGPGGTLYVPAGTYYVGSDREYNIDFGRVEPRGISWHGDGPTESVVTLTEHMDRNDQSHVLMYYADADHGTVEMQDIQLYGNSQNLSGLKQDNKRSSIGVQAVSNAGALECDNVLFDSWHDQAVRTREDWRAEFRECTFFECGAESRKEGYSGHTLSLGGNATFRQCRIRRAGSFVVNYSDGDGVLRMRECYVKGYGSGLVKLSSGETVDLENVFVQGRTPWVRDNYPENDDPTQTFRGRTFVDQILDDNGIRKRLRLRDVEFSDCTMDGIRCRHDMLLDADRVAIYNANSEDIGKGAISSQGGGDLHFDMSGQEISIHDSKGYAIDVRSDSAGTGTIGTLYRDGNTDGLGEIDEITITHQHIGAGPLSPDTPAENETGINSPRTDR